MPGKVGVKIKAGRNLPVMDRSSDTTDAYVEIKLGNVTHKTDVCRKSLNPQWNTDWFRFEVDDAELQDEPLQIRLMDYDTYSANDAIGKVNISLNPLCLEMSGPTTHGKGTVLSGWIPVFDTMHGIRGEVNVIVKVDLFSDLNKFRQSSCGIPFFHSQCIPYGYRAQMIHGFVEELVVNDDPEYQWIDKIRTPRASNEARQVVFLKLSGQVQRKMGLKAINMGANAVIGYTQCFDLEGDVGVVARGIGTAVTLIKDTSSSQPAAGTADNTLIEERTKKYIEFLTGSHINLAEQPPPCELQIHKSHSSILFDLQHANTGAMEDNEIMHDLMRQEDERGEKPAKKLRHHMKRFTHSSRNILNEKYNAFMRKFGESVESKSPSSTSRSLSSLCASGGLIKDDATTSGSSGRSSTGTAYDLRRRPSFKAKHKMFGVGVGGVTTKPFLQRQSTVKRSSGSCGTGGSATTNPHAILRSVSAEYNAANKTGSPIIASISEYSDSTRSSPNICGDGHDDIDYDEEQLAAMLGKQTQFYCNKNYDYKTPSLASGSCDRSDSSSCVDVVAAIGGYHPFGEFSQHEPHQLQLNVHDTATIHSCSPNTFSLSNSDSSGSEAELARELARGEAVEHVKMQKYLKICKDTEEVDAKWIQPSELESFDDSLTDLTPRRSLLRDLKTLSQHVQDFIHSKPKKVEISPTPSPQQQRRAAAPSQETNTLLLQPPSEESKAYYSSQPEICLNWDGDMCAPPPTTHISHSRSLINLRRSDANSPTTTLNIANAPEFDLTTTKDDMHATNAYGFGYVSDSDSSSAYLPVTVKSFASNAKCPVFKICPSTPSPSETDLKISFIEDDASTVLDDSASETTEIPTPILGNSTLSIATVSAAPPLDFIDVIANSPVTSRKYVVGNTSSSSISSPQRSPSTPSVPKPYYSNAIKKSTNHNSNNIVNSHLLAPPPLPLPLPLPSSPTLSSSRSLSSTQLFVNAPVPTSSPCTPLLCTKNRQHRSRESQSPHHRSLNEVNAAAVASNNALVAAAAAASSGITDSPSLKRFASPAQAAVVAAAAAMPSANTLASAPSSASLVPGSSSNGGRAKLSASPSKLALNSVGAASANNPITSTAGTALNTSVSSTASTTDGGATNSIPAPSKDSMPTEMCRRSSDSDLSITPKVLHRKRNSLCVASERLVAATALMRLNQPLGAKNANTDGMDGLLEYPFLTMTKYPPGFILHLGATVAARSVKLLERVPNPDEPEVRDSWWTELRMEIRSHARALGCNVVLGYSEATTISDDVCVLSATGTAAVINMAYNRSVSQTDILNAAVKPVGIGFGVGSTGGTMSASLEERETLKDMRNGIANETISSLTKDTTMSSSLGTTIHGSVGKKNAISASMGIVKSSACSVCHVPYNLASVPFNVKMKKCAICRKGRVPDVLLATLEVPERLHVTGRGCFMQAQVVRAKKDLRSELNAKEISDGLPFLEYELHRVLINKLKAKGMNAIFGLRAQVAIGERMIALIATGTALFLSALPVPQVPKIVAGNSWTDKQKLNELQKKLQETFERNQEIYQLKCIDPDLIGSGVATLDKQSDTDESDDEVIEIDLNCGNKDTCVLEVDDIEDLEIISLLMETYPPEGFHVVNTQSVPGMLEMEAVKNLQMFTQVWRAKLDVSQNISGFPKHFQRILQTIYFKLRTMIPCAICDLRFRLDLPESDQIQLLVTGMALGLDDANKFKYRRKAAATNFTNGTANDAPDANGMSAGNKRTLQEEDYIFPLDEDQMVETPTPTSNLPPYGMNSFKMAKTSPSRQQSKKGTLTNRNNYFPLRDRYGVDITPLSFVPGGRIDKYLGNLNFFFIRETTSIRENGGISGFVHSFITELLAVVRAHISALGGNAMVSFYMSELILVDNQHKNQGQCLISIGGDAVYVSYHADD
ncbi:C2 domain-containing protein 5 isoform X1 [Bactrocera neohumeralis]|uniref:C2 domain-containing protein 5 isoform X1 n=1 Tax=Bactrocera neohumeralis TaxID=98809 RepID=UPI0021658BB8|nr:C2 domain-containing protein 5 isoform X1 [Bactrocera neohumeralis]